MWQNRVLVGLAALVGVVGSATATAAVLGVKQDLGVQASSQATNLMAGTTTSITWDKSKWQPVVPDTLPDATEPPAATNGPPTFPRPTEANGTATTGTTAPQTLVTLPPETTRLAATTSQAPTTAAPVATTTTAEPTTTTVPPTTSTAPTTTEPPTTTSEEPTTTTIEVTIPTSTTIELPIETTLPEVTTP